MRAATVLEFLAVLWPEVSKEALRALFARGAVRADGRPISPHGLAGDFSEIEVHARREDLRAIHHVGGEGTAFRIVHEDDRIVVLDKPSGVPVVPDRSREGPSCLGLLVTRELSRRREEGASSGERIRVVHRIDRLTSGVVLFAKTAESERTLAGWFERGAVRKEYLALVLGEVAAAQVAVDVPIGPGRKGKMRGGPEGKESLTVFTVLECFTGFTLLRAEPRTGRTHQIRVHAWAMGHPLAVDPLYRVGAAAQGAMPPAITRLTLHASSVTLPEEWGGPGRFHAELPYDFRAALEALRANRQIERPSPLGHRP